MRLPPDAGRRGDANGSQQFPGDTPAPQRLQSRYPVMAYRGPIEHIFAGRGADQHIVRPLAFILPADEPPNANPFSGVLLMAATRAMPAATAVAAMIAPTTGPPHSMPCAYAA